MKHFLFSFVALALPWLALTAEEVTRLSIEHTDGTSTHIMLSEAPTMTFDGADMVVKSSSFDLRVPRTEVAKFHFTKDEYSSIEEVAADDYLVSYSANTLTVAGSDVTLVMVYDLSGRQVASVRATDGTATVDLGACTPGIYVVAVKGHPSFKIAVR